MNINLFENKNKFHILALTETWLKDIDDPGIYFPDHVFTQNKICKTKKRGGVHAL